MLTGCQQLPEHCTVARISEKKEQGYNTSSPHLTGAGACCVFRLPFKSLVTAVPLTLRARGSSYLSNIVNCIVSKWVYVFDYPHPQAILHCFPLEQIVLNLRWDTVQGMFSHPRASPLPGLISCVAVDDSFTPTQQPSSVFLAIPFIFFLLFFLRPSFPFLILRGSVLAHADDAELWAATHRTVRRSGSQTLPGFLLRRSVTGEYGRMGFISLDFFF